MKVIILVVFDHFLSCFWSGYRSMCLYNYGTSNLSIYFSNVEPVFLFWIVPFMSEAKPILFLRFPTPIPYAHVKKKKEEKKRKEKESKTRKKVTASLKSKCIWLTNRIFVVVLRVESIKSKFFFFWLKNWSWLNGREANLGHICTIRVSTNNKVGIF